MRITVFGGALARDGDPAYIQAYQLGQFIGRSGHVLLTGGYMGIMEGASRGAAEAGGHVIGITSEEIERLGPVAANPWIREEWRKPTLYEREWCLMVNCDLAVALPGGMGTLAEISTMWNYLSLRLVPAQKLFIVGGIWRQVFTTISQNLDEFTREKSPQFIHFAPTLSEVMEEIRDTSS